MFKRIVRQLIFLALALAFSAHVDEGVRAREVQAIATSQGDLRALIERYTSDRESLFRTYRVRISPVRQARLKQFYEEWLDTLRKVDFDGLSEDGKIDYLLLQNHLAHELRQLALRQKQVDEMSPLIPFAKIILEFEDSRRRMNLPNPARDAGELTKMTKEISKTRAALEAGMEASAKPAGSDAVQIRPIRAIPTVARRAAITVSQLRETLKNWFTYYNGYDPLFTWWAAESYKEADGALEDYGKFLSEKLAGIKPDDKTTVIGDPVGREALLLELSDNLIPYTPEELIALAKNEMAWCTKEMIRASREMGHGDDWHKALEQVKDMHVEPGQQPELIRKLAWEAIEYVEKNDLVTVPALAKETWGMEMMSPERQLVNPFFTGGELISVSYPTDTMTFEQRMMSMRGNNIPFARATVFHELIPGHHLQAFMMERYRSYRRIFETPFWEEGNAFYWEMLLWDLGFPQTPAERVGMLFWRMHRCARIIFSLSFHLGLMTPQQCVEFLVKDVGHEPDNATAEVRRSFDGSVGPLYQCAYMLGALQFRAMHKELVESGKMTNREFHDAILQENSIPVELLRARLTHQKLTRDFQSSWKFYGPIAATP
jgi:uncharacterized protein (DUF885 family)